MRSGQRKSDHPTAVPMGPLPSRLVTARINLAASGQAMFEAFTLQGGGAGARPIDDPQFASEARGKHREALNSTAIAAATPHAAPAPPPWIEALSALSVPCGPVNRIDEVFYADPPVIHLGAARGVTHPRHCQIYLVAQYRSRYRNGPRVAHRRAPGGGAHPGSPARN